jgi:hypothetical protein
MKSDKGGIKIGFARQEIWNYTTSRNVSALAKIQAATQALPREQQEELYRFLGSRLHAAAMQVRKARVVRQGGDTLLEAPSDAPLMSADSVKQMLEDWP